MGLFVLEVEAFSNAGHLAAPVKGGFVWVVRAAGIGHIFIVGFLEPANEE